MTMQFENGIALDISEDISVTVKDGQVIIRRRIDSTPRKVEPTPEELDRYISSRSKKPRQLHSREMQ